MIDEFYQLFKLDDVPITKVICDFLDKHGIEGTPQIIYSKIRLLSSKVKLC